MTSVIILAPVLAFWVDGLLFTDTGSGFLG